jgi:hypothetical protein
MMFDSMLNNLFSVFATGQGSSGTAAMDIDFIQGGNASAIDTTLAQVLAFTVILPAANALLDMTLKSAVVEII